MKTRYIILLFIVIQLASCSKRYGYLKKVRVGNASQQTIPATHRLPKPATPEMASSDTGSTSIEVVSDIPDDDSLVNELYQNATPKQHLAPYLKQAHLAAAIIPPSPSDTLIQQPEERKWNKSALISGGVTLVTIVLAVLLWSNLVAAIVLMGMLGSVAFFFACKGYKETKGSKEKGRGLALVAMALSAMAAFAWLAFLPAFLFSFSGKSDQVFYNTWLVFTGILAAIAVFAQLYQKKVKPIEGTSKDAKPKLEQPAPAPHNYNGAAVAALICALVFLLSVICMALFSGALFGTLALLSPLAALILGIVALFTIRKTHQKGKWMAWVGILAIPGLLVSVALVLSPIFAIVAIVGVFISLLW